MNQKTKQSSHLINLSPERFFSAEPTQREIAHHLFDSVKYLPLVCPFGNVDPAMFSNPEFSLGTPTDLLVLKDEFIVRMLYSQGFRLEEIGLPGKNGRETEKDHRKIWSIFADNFHIFSGTSTGSRIAQELRDVFGVELKLNSENAQTIYKQISNQLESAEFRPRVLFDKFNIEILASTHSAADSLEHHREILKSGWSKRIIPTFSADSVTEIDSPKWIDELTSLGNACGFEISSFKLLVKSLGLRREFFKSHGAASTDSSIYSPFSVELGDEQVESIFQRALRGEATAEDVSRFTGRMLMEMARMSVEDGLVMQIHPGSFRSHNKEVFDGTGNVCDSQIQAEFPRNIKPILEKFGNDRRLTLVLFTLDESAYSRELAAIASYYPAVKLGPPWKFYDSPNGMRRYREAVMETGGIYNTAGFSDNAHDFPSIPARHDFTRRIDADWLAGLVVKGVIDEVDATKMIQDLSYNIVKKVYRLDYF